jgi:hypothetical protein
MRPEPDEQRAARAAGATLSIPRGGSQLVFPSFGRIASVARLREHVAPDDRH